MSTNSVDSIQYNGQISAPVSAPAGASEEEKSSSLCIYVAQHSLEVLNAVANLPQADSTVQDANDDDASGLRVFRRN
jgi:hypothetical protein